MRDELINADCAVLNTSWWIIVGRGGVVVGLMAAVGRGGVVGRSWLLDWFTAN